MRTPALLTYQISFDDGETWHEYRESMSLSEKNEIFEDQEDLRTLELLLLDDDDDLVLDSEYTIRIRNSTDMLPNLVCELAGDYKDIIRRIDTMCQAYERQNHGVNGR